MRAHVVVPLFVLAAAGLDGCKPAQSVAPPPPPPRLGPIEAPEDIVATILVRDPAAMLETTAHAAGEASFKVETFLAEGPPEVAALAPLVDVHGPAGGAVFGNPLHPDGWHFAVALKLRDGKDARARVAERVKSGQLRAEESAAIRSKIYLTEKGPFALIGEAVVLSDSRDTLEATGRWIVREGTEGTPPHDAAVRVPLSRFAVTMRNELKKLWDADAQKDADLAVADPLMQQVLQMVAGFGDVQLAVDLEKEDAIVDLRLGATGMFSQWLAKYPAGPARSILGLPRSSSAFVVRFPDAVADIFKSVVDDSVAKAKPSKEIEDVRTLVRTLGHEVAFANVEKTKDGETKTVEAMVRLDLVDAAAAKPAIKGLIASMVAKGDRKVTRSPWAKLGADGESVTVTDGADKYDARWAIKGNQLYVDVAWDGKVTLLDAALDPSGKALLSNNPRAKTFADRLPKDGVALAYYAETPKAPKLEELGAVPSLMGVRWGFAAAAKDGVTSQWNVPLADFGRLLHSKEKTELSGPVGIKP